MQEDQNVLVSVCVITYNQDKFIRKCLDSILMQDIDFRYEVVVGDDCSSDSTQAILIDYQTRYPSTIVPVFSDKNTGISANYQRVLSRCRAKYIALCEGDDFWIDSRRLQKQVDFLEGHPDYGFVGGNVNILMNERMTFESYDYLPEPVVDGEWELYGNVFDLAKYGPVTRTVTICFRRAIIDPYISIQGIGNDLVLQTILAKNSSFAKLSTAIGAYRQNGISTSKDSINSIIRYANWRFECLSLQKQLFPEECNWNDDEISDQRYFAVLRYYLRHFQYKKLKDNCDRIKSKKFRGKISYKFSGNFFSAILLGIWARIRIETIN